MHGDDFQRAVLLAGLVETEGFRAQDTPLGFPAGDAAARAEDEEVAVANDAFGVVEEVRGLGDGDGELGGVAGAEWGAELLGRGDGAEGVGGEGGGEEAAAGGGGLGEGAGVEVGDVGLRGVVFVVGRVVLEVGAVARARDGR